MIAAKEYFCMYKGDLITITKACELLGVSTTTLRTYRSKYHIWSTKVRKEVQFSKTEILYKIYSILNPQNTTIDLSINMSNPFENFKIDDTTYDLRRIDAPDGHGAISLLCHLVWEIREERNIHLLINEANHFLKSMNFFAELKRYFNSSVFWDEEIFDSITVFGDNSLIKLPITRLGVIGAQMKVVDDLTACLSRQGHSNDICTYIGWAMGELADNSATHAKTHPSFAYFEQFGDDNSFLQFTIGDTGIGISESLRKNDNYKDLEDSEAILTAFKPYVSGRSDEEERGKGLTDVLMIAMECGSRLRVESNGVGFLFSFDSGLDNFEVVEPMCKGSGTIISILFIDGNFGSIEREDVSEYIDTCLEKI